MLALWLKNSQKLLRVARYCLLCAVHRCFISNTGQTPTWRASDSHGITCTLLLPYWNTWGGFWQQSRIKRFWGISHATGRASFPNACLPSSHCWCCSCFVTICQILWDRTEVLLKSKTLLSKRKAATHHPILPRTMTPVRRGRDGSWLLTEIREEQLEHTWYTGRLQEEGREEL